MSSTFQNLGVACFHFMRLCNNEELTNCNELIFIPGSSIKITSQRHRPGQGDARMANGAQDQNLVLLLTRILP